MSDAASRPKSRSMDDTLERMQSLDITTQQAMYANMEFSDSDSFDSDEDEILTAPQTDNQNTMIYPEDSDSEQDTSIDIPTSPSGSNDPPDFDDIEAKKAYYASMTFSDSDEDSEEDEDEITTQTESIYTDNTISTSTEIVCEVVDDWDDMLDNYRPITRRGVEDVVTHTSSIEPVKKKQLTFEEWGQRYDEVRRRRQYNRWRPAGGIYDIEEETEEDLKEFERLHGEDNKDINNISPSKNLHELKLSVEDDYNDEQNKDDDDEYHLSARSPTTAPRSDVLSRRLAGVAGEFSDMAQRGTRMIKCNTRGLSHAKLVRITHDGLLDWFTGRVSLMNVLTIRDSRTKPCRFSVYTAQRRVILETCSPMEREVWVTGLRKLVEQIQCNTTTSSNKKNKRNDEKEEDNDDNDDDMFGFCDNSLMDEFRDSSSAGIYLIRHSARGSKPKLVRVNHITGMIDWESNERDLSQAEIYQGKTTKLLKKLDDLTAPKEMCLSLVWPDKELNVQFTSIREMDMWNFGLHSLKSRLLSDKRQDEVESRESWIKMSESGVKFLKHGRYGRPHKRLVFVDCKEGLIYWTKDIMSGNYKNDETKMKTSFGKLIDVIGIERGKCTNVFKRVNDTDANPNFCFSLVWIKRTLDLEAGNEAERDLWVSNLILLRDQIVHANTNKKKD